MALVSWISSDPAQNAENGSPSHNTDVLLRNLSLLSREEHLLQKRRTAQIAELAALIDIPSRTHLRDTLAEFAERHLMQADKNGQNEEILLLCKELTRHGSRKTDLPSAGDSEDIFAEPPEISSKAAERVAYLQNRFTDEAFLKLTSHLTKPRAAYFSSFSDVSEEVYHGLCEYCILPVESSSDGKLLRFYALIEKFDLKIAAVCDIDAPNGGYTRYALLRHKYVPLHFPKPLAGALFAEFGLITDDRFSLSDILRAADLCHMKLLRADSLPLPYKENEYRYDTVFFIPQVTEATRPDLEAFLLYLSVTLPEYTPLGVYEKIQ